MWQLKTQCNRLNTLNKMQCTTQKSRQCTFVHMLAIKSNSSKNTKEYKNYICSYTEGRVGASYTLTESSLVVSVFQALCWLTVHSTFEYCKRLTSCHLYFLFLSVTNVTDKQVSTSELTEFMYTIGVFNTV